MTLPEMHSTFRVLGQQMGMQLVRGILPESIDVYINNVISEEVHKNLLLGVRTAIQESVDTQASTMSSINNFRTLYRSARFYINTEEKSDQKTSTDLLQEYNSNNGYHIIHIPTINSKVNVDTTLNEYKINPMMYLGFSIEYDNLSKGNSVACRMIGADVLETTLRDFCNGASKDSPIVSLLSFPIVNDGVEVEQINACNEQLEIYTNSKNAKIQYLNIKYIKNPNVVKWDINPENCINCDLPAYTHYDIVEKAVRKFFVSVGAVSNNPQRQQVN